MTGQELVTFARSKLGTKYVYGTKGELLTQANYNYLRKAYGKNMVWDSDEDKVGEICVDCSGLFSWATGVVLSSTQMFDRAIRKEPISTIKMAPIGAAVWMKGHIGMYTGLKSGVPYYIAADGSAYGVREVPLSKNKFTHWLLMKYIDYTEVDDEMVSKENIILNGKEIFVDAIRKDGYVFVKVRDLAQSPNVLVTNKGSVPVLDIK